MRTDRQAADSSEPTAVVQAERTLELTSSSPRRARSAAEHILRRAEASHDREAATLAERALGLVALELKDGAAAVTHLKRALHIALEAGLEVRAAEARMSLARALLLAGDSRGAFREIERARGSLRGLAAARLDFQGATLLHHHHRLDEALAGYRAALGAFRRAGDQLWEARALNNRGLVHAARGSLAPAEADLLAAGALYSSLGLELALADVQHNLGWVSARRGDVPTALTWYDQSEERRRHAGVPLANGLADRCELLLSVRLIAEARAAAEQAVGELAAGGMASETAEARLMLAEASLLDHDYETARSQATTASRSFSRQHRPRWASRARSVALRASYLQAGASPAQLLGAQRAAAALEAAGWRAAALDARILVARIALELGRTDLARRTLARIHVGVREPVELRVRAKHASALLAVAEGRRRQAHVALRAGMQLLDEHRATLGATELRASVTGQGEEVAELGLRLAVEDGDELGVFAWHEEWRASAIRPRPVRPPEDTGVAAELAELRRVVSLMQADEPLEAEARVLSRRRAELEESVRRRTRRAAGVGGPAIRPRAFAEIAQLLGERALVAYFELDGALAAITVVDGAPRIHPLQAAEQITVELDALRFALRRLARETTLAPSRAASYSAAVHAADALDAALLGPLATALGERPLVIVPTGHLHAMPWSIAPSLVGRPVTVAPSASAWAEAEISRLARGRQLDRVTVAAGPGLPFAHTEARAVATLYEGADALVGAAATAASVLARLEGADLAHLAAHGTFRADNPLFSSLRLADGPLTVYDLESLRRAPRLCVLSACESGLSDVQAGDELMGLTAALLALGTATVIASVVPVPDEPTRDVMRTFHRQLRAGLSPAEALARVRTQGDDSGSRLVARAGFVCFGAG